MGCWERLSMSWTHLSIVSHLRYIEERLVDDVGEGEEKIKEIQARELQET